MVQSKHSVPIPNLVKQYLCTKGRKIREMSKKGDKDMDSMAMKCIEVLAKLERLERELGEVQETQKNVNKQTNELVSFITKRGIIVHDLDMPAELTRCRIARTLGSLSGVNLQAEDIHDFQRMGEKTDSPLQIIFDTSQKKTLILKNKARLENRGVTVEDYNPITDTSHTEDASNDSNEQPKTEKSES